MKKRIMAALLLAVILCGLWAAPALAATYATVVGGWLRLRLAPSYDATVITSYRTGTTVTVLSESGGWARVMTPDYRLGYMDERYLWFGGDRPQPVPQPTPKARTWTTVNRKAWVTSQNGKGVRLRNAPEVNSYNVMGLYPVGRTVTEMKVSNDGWSYIRIDRKTGYMMSQFLTTGNIPAPVPPPPPPQNPPKPTQNPTNPPQNPTNPPATQPPQTPPQGFSGVRLSTQSPRVGEKITLTVVPEGARYSVIWIRESTMTLLSTGNSYTPTAADVGSRIRIRVTGADGTVAETTTTNAVEAAGSASGSAPLSAATAPDQSGAGSAPAAGTGSSAENSSPDSSASGQGTPAQAAPAEPPAAATESTPAQPAPPEQPQTQTEQATELPEFVKRMLEEDPTMKIEAVPAS